MDLFDLPLRVTARITCVASRHAGDEIAQRLDELGFVPGECVRVIGRGPLGREPVAVQVGHTRFALRRSEAQRVRVSVGEGPAQS